MAWYINCPKGNTIAPTTNVKVSFFIQATTSLTHIAETLDLIQLLISKRTLDKNPKLTSALLALFNTIPHHTVPQGVRVPEPFG